MPLVSEREGVVRTTVARFAEILHRPLPSGPLPPLDDSRFERVLCLHMAALAWASDRSFTAESLMEEILDHEQHFWLVQAKAAGDGIGEFIFVEKARRAVAGLTLSGGAPSEERARALLQRVNDALDERLLKLLQYLYPGRREGPSGYTFLSGLEPDLLGESMVWRTLNILRERGDSVEAFLERVFEDATEQALVTGFELLHRLSENHSSDLIRRWVVSLLDGNLAVRAVPTLEASKAIGRRTAHAFLGMELASALEREGTLELAEQLEAAGVPDFTVSLREVRAWVTKRRLDLHPSEMEGRMQEKSLESLSSRACQLNNLGVDQRELGQFEAALGSTLKAVEHYRALAKTRPDAFLLGARDEPQQPGQRAERPWTA